MRLLISLSSPSFTNNALIQAPVCSIEDDRSRFCRNLIGYSEGTLLLMSSSTPAVTWFLSIHLNMERCDCTQVGWYLGRRVEVFKAVSFALDQRA
jgi:hypothetical protein